MIKTRKEQESVKKRENIKSGFRMFASGKENRGQIMEEISKPESEEFLDSDEEVPASDEEAIFHLLEVDIRNYMDAEEEKNTASLKISPKPVIPSVSDDSEEGLDELDDFDEFGDILDQLDEEFDESENEIPVPVREKVSVSKSSVSQASEVRKNEEKEQKTKKIPEIQDERTTEPFNTNWEKKRSEKKGKRKKIRLTILLLLLFICVLGAGITMIYKIRGKSFDVIDHPYNVVNEFTNPVVSGSHQRSETFASELCVLDENIRLESSLLEPQQKGLLFDLGSKEVLFSQGAFDKVYPASITKIMTAMLALKYGKMTDYITITDEDLRLEEGSQVCGFWSGDTLTLEQLLNALLVYSGNDAAAAIARHIGGSTKDFVALMNNYAKELGCTGTHFTNPHGLQDENHYTTPYDIYLMLKEALNYPEFTAITQQSEYTLQYTRVDGYVMITHLAATDHYLTGEANAPKGVTILGGKTGTTSQAGNCLALLCQDVYGKPYCSIVMKANQKETLYEQMNSLLQNINR